ncbi:hypothetical protein Misp01_12650 [Microtetraspora sp. NBRC 13810]|nr:hypothetical protein Misp01_12650 [Microtetraspora sp. NBRC 13810]
MCLGGLATLTPLLPARAEASAGRCGATAARLAAPATPSAARLPGRRCAKKSPGARRTTTHSWPEYEVIRLTNLVRRIYGCGPVLPEPRLHAAALWHSRDMAAQGYFSHTSRDGRELTDRLAGAGLHSLRSWGENIAHGYETPAAAVRGWLTSPGHRANIVNCRYTHIGVGLAGNPDDLYWTQNFAGR